MLQNIGTYKLRCFWRQNLLLLDSSWDCLSLIMLCKWGAFACLLVVVLDFQPFASAQREFGSDETKQIEPVNRIKRRLSRFRRNPYYDGHDSNRECVPRDYYLQYGGPTPRPDHGKTNLQGRRVQGRGLKFCWVWLVWGSKCKEFGSGQAHHPTPTHRPPPPPPTPPKFPWQRPTLPPAPGKPGGIGGPGGPPWPSPDSIKWCPLDHDEDESLERPTPVTPVKPPKRHPRPIDPGVGNARRGNRPHIRGMPDYNLWEDLHNYDDLWNLWSQHFF